MTRLSADHPTVTTYTGTVVRYGTRRHAVAFPADCPLAETVLRVVVDGTELFTQLQTGADGRWLLTGLYDRPATARAPDGQSPVLTQWLADRDLDRGRTAYLDVIERDVKYGLRGPGEEAVYDAPDSSTAGLMDIARELDDE